MNVSDMFFHFKMLLLAQSNSGYGSMNFLCHWGNRKISAGGLSRARIGMHALLT